MRLTTVLNIIVCLLRQHVLLALRSVVNMCCLLCVQLGLIGLVDYPDDEDDDDDDEEEEDQQVTSSPSTTSSSVTSSSATTSSATTSSATTTWTNCVEQNSVSSSSSNNSVGGGVDSVLSTETAASNHTDSPMPAKRQRLST